MERSNDFKYLPALHYVSSVWDTPNGKAAASPACLGLPEGAGTAAGASANKDGSSAQHMASRDQVEQLHEQVSRHYFGNNIKWFQTVKS